MRVCPRGAIDIHNILISNIRIIKYINFTNLYNMCYYKGKS